MFKNVIRICLVGEGGVEVTFRKENNAEKVYLKILCFKTSNSGDKKKI